MQDCDVTLKTLLTGSTCLLRHLGANAPVVNWLNVELPKVQNQRVDLLAELASGDLLHSELQSTHEPDMPRRMLEYAVGIWRRCNVVPRQVVLYVGNDKLRIAAGMRSPDIDFRYTIVDIRDLDSEELLASESIADNILAVLARNGNSPATIRRIIAGIIQLEQGKREDALRRLLILSGVRGSAKTVQHEGANMPVTFDIMDNEVLGPVLRKGIEQGRMQILRSQLEKRFGPLPAWADQRLAAISGNAADDLALRLLDADSLDTLLGRTAAS